MIERQLSFTQDGRIRDNVEAAIEILKMFEPPEGYYLAFSGGKDSQCVYHLAKDSGVKFDAHYAVTSVDSPELVRFIKTNYPDVELKIPHDKEGKPITMWSLIQKRKFPPTRAMRYCCSELKESNGKYRVTLTGVRSAESPNRKANQGMVLMRDVGKKTRSFIDDMGVDYKNTKRGGIVLNYDNDETKLLVEHCYRTTKTLVNPIIDWKEEDVWNYLNSKGIEHCCLYDEGFNRIGCIGCPMNMKINEQFNRWPKYKENYLKAFERMIERRKADGLDCDGWETAEDVFEWWTKR